VEDMHDWAASL